MDDQRTSASLDAAEEAAVVNFPGAATVACQLTGTWTATVTFEQSVDGTNYVAVAARNRNTGAAATTATANGIYLIPAAGASYTRARVSAYTSGTVVVVMIASRALFDPHSVSTGGAAVDTELPAAAALAEGTTNPTTVLVGSCGMIWDPVNSHWHRTPSAVNIADGATGNVLPAAAAFLKASSGFDRMRTAQGDAQGATGLAAAANMLFNGATWDRGRTAPSAIAAAANTGVLYAQMGVWNTTGQIAPVAGLNQVVDGVSGFNSIPAGGYNYNGTTWDRARSNVEGTALASAARTTTTASADLTNYNAVGVRVFINVFAVTATPSITVAIQEKDPVSGNYIDILVSAAHATTGQKTTLIVHPGAAATANVSANTSLPRTWRINVTHGDADSITYSVSYCLIGS